MVVLATPSRGTGRSAQPGEQVVLLVRCRDVTPRTPESLSAEHLPLDLIRQPQEEDVVALARVRLQGLALALGVRQDVHDRRDQLVRRADVLRRLLAAEVLTGLAH